MGRTLQRASERPPLESPAATEQKNVPDNIALDFNLVSHPIFQLVLAVKGTLLLELYASHMGFKVNWSKIPSSAKRSGHLLVTWDLPNPVCSYICLFPL